MRQLRSGTRLLQLDLDEQQQQIAAEVKWLYWEGSYLRLQMELQSQLLTIQEQSVARGRALLGSGQITLGQSLSSKLDYMDLSLAQEALQAEIDEIDRQLQALCGVAPETIEFATARPLTESDFDFAYEDWAVRALESRADVLRYGELQVNAKAELDTIEARRIPWLKHVQTHYRVTNSFGAEDAAGIEVAIELPFFSSDAGEKRAANQLLQSYRAQAGQGRRSVELQVASLIEAFHGLKRQWRARAPQLERMSDELETVIETMEAQGSVVNENYWDARIALIELDLRELEQQRSYQALLLRAEHVVGGVVGLPTSFEVSVETEIEEADASSGK